MEVNMELSLKLDVSYNLDSSIKNDIKTIKDLIKNSLPLSNIYLFGSIAKGSYHKSSDIDILILIDEEKNTKELRALRHSLEDNIYSLNLEKDVDIKLYTNKRFLELSIIPCFESSIIKDLIDIKGW